MSDPIVRCWRRGCRRRTACRGPPLGDEVDDAERPMLGTLRPQAPNELVGLGPMLRKGGGRLPEDCGVGREEDASGWRLLAAGCWPNCESCRDAPPTVSSTRRLFRRPAKTLANQYLGEASWP